MRLFRANRGFVFTAGHLARPLVCNIKQEVCPSCYELCQSSMGKTYEAATPGDLKLLGYVVFLNC